MDIFFTDPEDIPLPPEEIRIQDLQVTPYPDGRRLRVLLELTPFQKYPSGEIIIADSLGNQVAVTNFIETVTPKLELTMHLRVLDPAGAYRISVTLFYTQEIEDERQGGRILVRPEKMIVDQIEKPFTLSD